MASGKKKDRKAGNPYDPGLVVRFHRRIRDMDPIVSAIITGHLLIEEQVWQVVSESVANPPALDDARLSFAQLVAVAEAVTLDSSLHSCWRLVRRLNALRNRCAHQTELGALKAELVLRI